MNASQLAALQAAVKRSFDQTCSIVRLSDAGGVLTATTLYTNVPLLVVHASRQQRAEFEQDQNLGRQMGSLLFQVGTDVQINDQVVVNGGKTWIVEAVAPLAPSSYQMVRQVFAYHKSFRACRRRGGNTWVVFALVPQPSASYLVVREVLIYRPQILVEQN